HVQAVRRGLGAVAFPGVHRGDFHAEAPGEVLDRQAGGIARAGKPAAHRVHVRLLFIDVHGVRHPSCPSDWWDCSCRFSDRDHQYSDGDAGDNLWATLWPKFRPWTPREKSPHLVHTTRK